MKFLIIYGLIAFGTWAGYDRIYREACPSEKFSYGPVMAGIVWPFFAGLAITSATTDRISKPVTCGNLF
jgi:hypothetical protein